MHNSMGLVKQKDIIFILMMVAESMGQSLEMIGKNMKKLDMDILLLIMKSLIIVRRWRH